MTFRAVEESPHLSPVFEKLGEAFLYIFEGQRGYDSTSILYILDFESLNQVN